MGITILGGKGFVGSHYVKAYYDQAIGNITSVNERDDYRVHSNEVLYFISTVTNSNVYRDPFLDINTNLTTLVKVLENWRARRDSAEGVFNFISSWFVDSNVKGFYTSTKRCAEELLDSYCKAFGLRYRIIRLANVVGPDPKASKEKNSLLYVMRRIKNHEPVLLQGGGNFHRDYIHVTDCVKAIETILAKGETNSVYNVGNGFTWSFKDIVNFTVKHFNSDSVVASAGGPVLSYGMCTSRLKDLGYTPSLSGERLYRTLCEEL